MKQKLLLFLAKFFVIFFLLSQLVELIDLSFLTNFLAKVSASFLGLDFLANQIFIDGAVFIVTNSCTGLISASILGAIIFALKKPSMFNKFKLFLFGTLLLLVVNVFRIIFILYFAKIGLDANLIHELTWYLMSGIIILIWYYCMEKVYEIKNFNLLV